MTDHRATPHKDAAGLPNPLPTELAFVVQFGAGIWPTDEIAAGRIEHVVRRPTALRQLGGAARGARW